MTSVEFWSPTSSMQLCLGDLRTDALSEGYRSIERLHDDWLEGRMRFSGKGEKLIVASVSGECVGVGGVTAGPIVTGALRVRRFYVRPGYRHIGLGRQLANKLFEHASRFNDLLTVNAGNTEAGLFWERMGFQPSTLSGITHQRLT